ncbi:PIN domain-containing protein [Dietzia sp. PP-33]|uniref:PIN domain-containing protein n=1 Tax=Dietzia sp. PP-33 TaxID=2957500 RepID=UPI0029A7283C|nr:PIN domain-containing protein [Dietzia sp. PP-33]MDX2358705.1 PIN domain-containing protein [Dietzia sp. PP-33]
MFVAVLDTCVLWPSLQRDVLLSLAAENLYRPLWSGAILEELEFHEARKLVGRGADPDDAAAQAAHLVEQMTAAFDDACVIGWEILDGSFNLPDPDDEHLVAAAVIGGAEAIVSDNVSDLPRGRVPAQIQVIKPAVFVADTVAVSPDAAVRALRTMIARRTNPPETLEYVLQVLEQRYGMVDAVEMMRTAAN